MWNAFSGFINDLGVTLLAAIEEHYYKTMYDYALMALQIEKSSLVESTVLSQWRLDAILSILYSFMLGLLCVKLIWKGYKVYALWRDGESETPPTEMLKGAIAAVVTAVAFPTLYELAVRAMRELVDELYMVIKIVNPGDYGTAPDIFILLGNTFSQGTTAALATTLLMVFSAAMYFRMMQQGVEVLIWRLGIPIAVIGLIDSDGGVFKPYIQILFQLLLTILIEWFLMLLAGNIVLASGAETTGILLASACEAVAINTPTILNRFLLAGAQRRSGGAQKTYTFAMLWRTLKGV